MRPVSFWPFRQCQSLFVSGSEKQSVGEWEVAVSVTHRLSSRWCVTMVANSTKYVQTGTEMVLQPVLDPRELHLSALGD